MQRSCVLLKFTSLFQGTRTLKYTKENNSRFSLNVKKPNLFFAILVLSLTESLLLKYSKNTQAEENIWLEKFQFRH